MFQNQKANILVLSIVAVLAISLATPVAQADLDIRGIYISTSKDHLDGTAITDPWVFEMWVDFEDTGTLDHIDVTGSASFTVSKENGHWEYEPEDDYSTLAALRGDYPEGTYTFDFENISDTVLRTVDLVYSGLSEPGGPVNFTYPSVNHQTGIPLNPMFTWDGVDSEDGDALGMWLWDPDTKNDIYWDAPVSMDTLDWTPGPLLPNHDYDLEVSVFEVINPQEGPALPTMTVGVDEFEYGLMNEYLNEIEFTTTPVPGAVFLGAIGISMVGWLCRHRAQ